MRASAYDSAIGGRLVGCEQYRPASQSGERLRASYTFCTPVICPLYKEKSVLAHVILRLQDAALMPDIRDALRHMAVYDEDCGTRWETTLSAIRQILGGAADVIAPFAAAWSLMYAASKRLDHLQDGDPVDDPLPTVDRLNAQYNLVFGYFVLAEGLLDLLPADRIPAHRISCVRRLW